MTNVLLHPQLRRLIGELGIRQKGIGLYFDAFGGIPSPDRCASLPGRHHLAELDPFGAFWLGIKRTTRTFDVCGIGPWRGNGRPAQLHPRRARTGVSTCDLYRGKNAGDAGSLRTLEDSAYFGATVDWLPPVAQHDRSHYWSRRQPSPPLVAASHDDHHVASC